jgi:transposase-like protein
MGSKYPQKLYTAEFKREAVRLLETSRKSGAQIATLKGRMLLTPPGSPVDAKERVGLVLAA